MLLGFRYLRDIKLPDIQYSKSISLMLCLLTCVISNSAYSYVEMDQCEIPENIYVVKISNEEATAKIHGSRQIANEANTQRGVTPRAYGALVNIFEDGYYNSYNNALRNTHIAVTVNPLEENISVSLHSDQKSQVGEGSVWKTNYLSFIDGKKNRYANFVCKGRELHLQWNGRDYNAETEMFSSATGELKAEIEFYQLKTSQEASRLKVSKLTNTYLPDWTLTGTLYWLRQTTVYGNSIRLNDVNFSQSEKDNPIYMPGKYRLGYELYDKERIYLDIQYLADRYSETSEENEIVYGMPTLRAILHLAKIELSQMAGTVTTSLYGANLGERMAQLDKAMLEALPADGQVTGDVTNLLNATDQVDKATQQVIQMLNATRNTQGTVGDLTAAHIMAERKTKQIEKAISVIKQQLETAFERASAQQLFLKQSARERQIDVDGTPIHQNGHPEENTTDLSVLDDDIEQQIMTPEKRELLDKCYLTSSDTTLGRYVHYVPKFGDSRYGFNTGIEIRVLPDRKNPIRIHLKSDKMLWSWGVILNSSPTGDFVIDNVTCRGPMFSADYSSGPVRATIRGVFDNINGKIYASTQWSTWDNSHIHTRAWSYTHSVATSGTVLALGYVGLQAMLYAINPAVMASATAIKLALAYSATSLVTSPLIPPELRISHHRYLTKVLAQYGLIGEGYYNGYGQEYFSTFTTLHNAAGVQ